MTNKTYKDFDKIYLGESDVASLVLRTWDSLELLKFGQDDSYDAYFVNEEIELPTHYTLVFSATSWLKIYDDFRLTKKIYGDRIEIYRAGEMGCLIYAPGGRQLDGPVLL